LRVGLKWSGFLLDEITAKEFANYMKKYPDLYEYLAHVVQRHSSGKKPLIVDLGVGPGLLAIEILKKIPNARIIGIDPSVSMLQLAKENARIETMQSVSESIPLLSNSTDMIVSRFSLTYWNKPNDSFAEMHRVLKPGGKVVLEALNRDFPKWRLFLIKLHMNLNRAGAEVINYHLDAFKNAFTIEQVKQFFTNTRFSIVESKRNKKDWKFIVVAEKK
jgi:ubiquinone/menaquinone biosynthesis C-methylase UbiE